MLGGFLLISHHMMSKRNPKNSSKMGVSVEGCLPPFSGGNSSFIKAGLARKGADTSLGLRSGED